MEIYDDANDIIATASGFIIEDGTVLVTNYHVIDGAHYIIAYTPDGKTSTEVHTILSYDKSADLAILKCENSTGAPPLLLGDSEKVRQGDEVFAVGYPLGVANTLSDGIVSSRYVNEQGIDLLQITAPISGGSSGGALLNKSGQVVGVICAYYTNGQNMNIAVPSNTIAEVLSKSEGTLSIQEHFRKTHPEKALTGYYVCARTISVPSESLAEQIYQEWSAGSATESTMVTIMNAYGLEQGGGQLYFVSPNMWVDEVDQWCFDPSRRSGDAAIIKNVYGYSICYFSDIIKAGTLHETLTGQLIEKALRNRYEEGSIALRVYEELQKNLLQANSQEEYLEKESLLLGN